MRIVFFPETAHAVVGRWMATVTPAWRVAGPGRWGQGGHVWYISAGSGELSVEAGWRHDFDSAEATCRRVLQRLIETEGLYSDRITPSLVAS